MKVNLQIEIDWLDEDMTVDEIVKQEIIDGVTTKIEKKVYEQVEGKINSTIDENVVKKVDQLTEDMFKEFLSRSITLHDRWGKEISAYENLEDLVKERFDNFMTQKVDSNGKVSTWGNENKFDRISFIIDEQLKKFANKFTDDAVKTVSKEIKQHVQEGLTTKLGAELMKVLKVEKLLKA